MSRWWSRRPAVICLAVALCASGALLIALGSHLVFDGDDWNVVLDRRGHSPSDFLDPHQGHLVLAVVVVYKLLLVSFGMSSPLPFHAVSTLFYLLAAALMFVYIRRRVGDWLALLATAVILFFGASALDVLSSFQIFFSGAMAAGLGALLALDRGDRRGDVAACLLLAISISFSELGIAFTVGVLVRMALACEPLVGRVYVVLVPLALYGLWWLGWGHNGPSFFSLHKRCHDPGLRVRRRVHRCRGAAWHHQLRKPGAGRSGSAVGPGAARRRARPRRLAAVAPWPRPAGRVASARHRPHLLGPRRVQPERLPPSRQCPLPLSKRGVHPADRERAASRCSPGHACHPGGGWADGDRGCREPGLPLGQLQLPQAPERGQSGAPPCPRDRRAGEPRL